MYRQNSPFFPKLYKHSVSISLYFVPGPLKRQNLKFCIYFLLSNIHNMFRHSALITWYLIFFWKGDDNRSLIMKNVQNMQNMQNISQLFSRRKTKKLHKISESESSLNSRTCLGHFVLFSDKYKDKSSLQI